MDTREQEILQVAERQLAHFSRSQALAAGFSSKMIHHRLCSGAWVKVQRGVYRLAGASPRELDRAQVGALVLPGGVVSHQSAVHHLGVPVSGTRRASVTVPVGTTHRLEGVVVHESTDLVAGDCQPWGPVRCTTPVRTVIDLAAVLEPTPLERLVDELLVARLIAVEGVRTRLEQLARRGKPGVRSLRTVLEQRGPGYEPPESELEARFLDLLDRAGLPTPERQAALPWRSSQRGRVDLLYRRARLIIECDGRRWHTRERDFERDRRRDNEAMLAGWRVLRVTWNELVNHPERVVADLRRLLDSGIPSRPAA
jgi:hypothetical protein